MTSYKGPIIDAHHHFWEPSKGNNPWLLPGSSIPFRYGSYESIKRSYLPPDLRFDARRFNLVGSVSMESEWNLDDSVGEMVYTERIAQRYGLPQAAVAHAVLRDPNVETLLERLSEFSFVKGVRNKPGHALGPSKSDSRQSLMSDYQWKRGFKLLRKFGLNFDLQTAWWQMPEAHSLAVENPDQLIVINHAALPSDRRPELMDGWSKAIALMASLPNVAIKVSGIGLPDQPWTVENNRIIVETITDNFGPGRMMFASNFPVDSLTGTYDDIYDGFIEMTRGWSWNEQLAAFAGNAVKYYGLSPALLN